jgi:hypothetical protein
MIIVEEIQLKDGMSGPAKGAAASVKALEHQMTVLKSSMKSAQDQMVKAQATGNTKLFASALKSSQQYKSALGQLESQMQASGAGSMGLQEELAGMTGGLSIAVEAIAAVGAAFGVAVIAGAAFAIASSEAKTQMLAMFDALGEGKITGEAVDDMLDGLRGKIGQTKEAMVPLVKSFMAMGVTSQDALDKMTTAALSAKALVGGAQAGADAFENLSKKINLASSTGQGLKIPLKGLGSLADMGLTVDDVARKMGVSAKTLGEQLKNGTANASKFGNAMQDALIEKGAGPLATMSLSVANLGGMLKEYLGDLFEDMGKDIKPFLTEVKSLFSILDSKANPSGQALKSGIEAFFKNVFAVATKVVPLVKHFLLDLVIYGLKAYLAVKPIVKSFNEWRQTAGGMKTISTVISTIGAVLLTVAAVIGVAVAAFVGLWAIMVGIGVVIWAFIAAVIAIPQMAGAALAEFFGKAPQMALDFVKGLASGISSGAGMVVDAVKGLASGAVDSFKGALGIHSPSKVMMALGGHTGAGFAQGLDDTAGDVHASASGISAAAFSGASSGGSSAAPAASGGGAQISVSVQIDGAGKSAMEITEEMVSLVFERVALAAGV